MHAITVIGFFVNNMQKLAKQENIQSSKLVGDPENEVPKLFVQGIITISPCSNDSQLYTSMEYGI